MCALGTRCATLAVVVKYFDWDDAKKAKLRIAKATFRKDLEAG